MVAFADPSVGRRSAPRTPSGVHEGKAAPRFVEPDQPGLEADRAGEALLAPQLQQAVGGGGEANAADFEEAGLFAQPEAAVEADAVHQHPGQCRRRSKLADEPGCV